MDFELLQLPDMPAGPIETLRRYLANPKRQMAGWGENVPGSLSVIILGLVAIELVLARRFVAGAGLSPTIVGETGIAILAIVFLQLVFIGAASSTASVFEKSGRPWAAFCYMNLGLSPLLVWLPLAVLVESLGWNPIVRLVALVILVGRTAGHWRDALQYAFKLSRLQTVFAFYGAFSAAGAVAVVFLYAVLLGSVLSLVG